MSERPLTPAERLLFELSRAAPSRARVEAACREGGAGAFMDLQHHAMRHGIQGLVLHSLSRLQRDGVWPESREATDEALTRLRRQTLFWDMEQDRVLTGLGRAGFDPLVLKGGALRRGIFAPVERAMGDLDILVRPDEVSGVLTSLAGLGYRSEYTDRARGEFLEHHHHDRVAHPAGFMVEVHWGLTRPYEAIRLDPERFLRRSIVLEAEGSPPIRVPRMEDTLVHTVSQSEQDAVRGLRRLIDLDRLASLPDLDWDDVRTHADTVGLRGSLCVALRLAQLCLGTEAPEDLARGRGLTPASRRAIAAMHPVRRLLEEPERGEAADFHLFRLWCARPDHRDHWLRTCLVGSGDPLHWVWLGEEDPEVEDERTTGLGFLLKLALYQSILSLANLRTRIRQSDDGGPGFWPSADAPDAHPTIQDDP
ncbi:MAG: nucleotidyltransferase family protein [Gemmatimonadetes bacterium]|nr:nucleotidyltransferase family protein [Gemmatimonadota bacterium]